MHVFMYVYIHTTIRVGKCATSTWSPVLYFFCVIQNVILMLLFLLVLRDTFVVFVCEVNLQYFLDTVYKLLLIKPKTF